MVIGNRKRGKGRTRKGRTRTTSLQSMRSAWLCPRRVIFLNACLNRAWSRAWLSAKRKMTRRVSAPCWRRSRDGVGYSLTNDCHSHAVRVSRASCEDGAAGLRQKRPRAGAGASSWGSTHVAVGLQPNLTAEGRHALAVVRPVTAEIPTFSCQRLELKEGMTHGGREIHTQGTGCP